MRKKSLDIVVGVMVSIVSSTLFAAVEDYARPDVNIVVNDTRSLEIAAPEVQVDVASSASVSFNMVDSDIFVRAQEGGTVAVKGSSVSETSWHGKVGLWLDASEEWTLEQEVSLSGKGQTVTENGVQSAAIVRWRDRRPEQTEWLGYNDRGKKVVNTGVYPAVMPYVVSNGCNGLTYVTLGNQVLYGRRMPFIKVVDGVEMSPGTGGANENYTLDVKYVMMVFGSQRGGGHAVVSGMLRTSTDGTVAASTGIFESKHETRLDGEMVDPTVTGLNGGWQVLSFVPPSSDTVKGLGWGKWNSNVFGGQNYAEVLMFTNKPSLYEIRSAEMYLSQKWGVSTYRAAKSGEARLFGSGEAMVTAGTVNMGGAFSGSVTVSKDAVLQLTDAHGVPSSPIAGMNGWYDPNNANVRSVETVTVLGNPVERIVSLVNMAAQNGGSPFDFFGFSRGPAITTESRGWGPEMTWCDYGTNRLSGLCNGTTLRLDGSIDGEEHCLPVRTGFMILDTRAGGGTPFLDTSVYSFSHSVTSQYVEARVNSSPIFRVKNKSAFVTNSLAFLNGIAVDSGKRAYNSRPELLSFSFDRDMPIRCLGAWQQTQAYTSDPAFELRHGEIIFYPTELSASDRKDTEAYLMSKWLGITPKGYGKPQNMTVTGAGTVKTANGRMRPKTAEAFTGRIEISDDVLTFSFDASSVLEDAISIESGELATSEAITVNLSFASRPEADVYVLVSAKAWNAATVELGEIEGPGTSSVNCSVSRNGNILLLTVTHPGMRVIVR